MSAENPYRELSMQEQPKARKSGLLRWFIIGSIVVHIATVIPLIYCLVEIQALKTTRQVDLTTPAVPSQVYHADPKVAENITQMLYRLDDLGFDLHQVIKLMGECSGCLLLIQYFFVNYHNNENCRFVTKIC